MNTCNLTSQTHPKAPAIIHLNNELVSASDYGHKEMRKLMSIRWIEESSMDQIMAARTLAKLWHAYKEEVVRRTGERYFDHPSGVALLLLLELGITDPEILSAAQLHDVLEDVKIDRKELENLIKRTASAETLRITQMVTNPEKTDNEDYDAQAKIRHYNLIFEDKKATLLKVADRMYNLRSLEIFHIDEKLLTEKHLKKAQEQVEESKKYILPLATSCNLWEKLFLDIQNVEKKLLEVSILLIQRKTKKGIALD